MVVDARKLWARGHGRQETWDVLSKAGRESRGLLLRPLGVGQAARTPHAGTSPQSSGMPDLNDLEEGHVDVPHELRSTKLAKAFVRTARRVQSSRSPRRLLRQRKNAAAMASPHAASDARPLVDEAWRAANADLWDQLWEKCPKECPISLWDDVVMDSPLNSSRPTRCARWACNDCWRELRSRGDFRCPFCRDSLELWQADRAYLDSLESDSEEDAG